jgi:hypothetical protein
MDSLRPVTAYLWPAGGWYSVAGAPPSKRSIPSSVLVGIGEILQFQIYPVHSAPVYHGESHPCGIGFTNRRNQVIYVFVLNMT